MGVTKTLKLHPRKRNQVKGRPGVGGWDYLSPERVTESRPPSHLPGSPTPEVPLNPYRRRVVSSVSSNRLGSVRMRSYQILPDVRPLPTILGGSTDCRILGELVNNIPLPRPGSVPSSPGSLLYSPSTTSFPQGSVTGSGLGL